MSPMSIIYALYRRDESRHNLTKVGSTKISADSRAVNYTDGEWLKYFECEVSSHIQFAVERTTHRILRNKGYWLDPRVTNGTAQEIFTCEPEEAKRAIIEALDMVKADLGRFIHPQTDRLLKEISRLRDDKRKLEERFESALSYRKEASCAQNSLAKAQDQITDSQKKIKSMQFRINELEFYIEEAGVNLPESGRRKGRRR